MSLPLTAVVSGLLICTVMSAAWGEEPVAGAGILYERVQNGALAVGGVLPNGPAAKADILAGDLIIAIDGDDVRGIADADVPNRVRGPVGSTVKITVVTPGQPPREVSVVREMVQRPGNPAAPAPAQPQPAVPPNAPANPPPLPNGPPAAANGMQRYRLAVLPDPMAGNIPAVTLLVPDGWQVQGGPVWVPDTSMAAHLRVKVSDPRTGLTIETLPVQSFTHIPNPMYPLPRFGFYQGRMVLEPIPDPDTLIKTAWPNVLPEIQQSQPVAKEEYPGRVQATLALMQAARVPGQLAAQSFRIRYEYQNNGQPFEADVYYTASYGTTQMGTMWDLTDARVYKGPKGSLDANAAMLRAVYQSIQMTPQWQASLQIVRQLFTQGLKQILQDQQVMAQKLAEYRDHTARLAQQISQERMASQDRQAEAFREVLGGVETYSDPYQGQNVYLPAGYKNYWVNNKGEYLLTDQTGFDPNVGSTVEWKAMPRRDPMNPSNPSPMQW